jgi:hypothetical protein
MNCFTHHDRAAVGICKSCGKGICPECLAELPNGLACKGSCEARVGLMNRALDSRAAVLSAATADGKTSGMSSLFIGVAFGVFAAWWYVRDSDMLMTTFFGVLGCVFLIVGVSKLKTKAKFAMTTDRECESTGE